MSIFDRRLASGPPGVFAPMSEQQRHQATQGFAGPSLTGTHQGSGSQPQPSQRDQPQSSAQAQAQAQAQAVPSGPPLLLNNLAQHLNNPPAPSQSLNPSAGGFSYPTSTSPMPGAVSSPGGPPPGGKLLLLPNGAAPPAGSEEEKIYELITELLDPATRETALLELSKKREMYEDLALVLWGGFGESEVTYNADLQASCRACCLKLSMSTPLSPRLPSRLMLQIECATPSPCCNAWRATPRQEVSSSTVG